MRFIVLPVDTCWGKSRLDFAVWYSAVSSDKALTTENHSFIKVTIPFNLQIITTCTQLSPLYQSTIYNAGVKFHITREKPNVKVQSCSLMWRSRCLKKKLNLPIFSTSLRNIPTKEPLVRSGLQNNNTQPFMCSKLTLKESKEIAARGQFVRHGKK